MELITLRLFEGDFKEMQDLYPKIKAGRIIRELIHRHIAVAKEMAARKLQSLPEIHIDISDLENSDEQSSQPSHSAKSSGGLSERPGATDQD